MPSPTPFPVNTHHSGTTQGAHPAGTSWGNRLCIHAKASAKDALTRASALTNTCIPSQQTPGHCCVCPVVQVGATKCSKDLKDLKQVKHWCCDPLHAVDLDNANLIPEEFVSSTQAAAWRDIRPHITLDYLFASIWEETVSVLHNAHHKSPTLSLPTTCQPQLAMS